VNPSDASIHGPAARFNDRSLDVLTLRAYPNVATTIVEAVAVDVINDLACLRIEQESMQGNNPFSVRGRIEYKRLSIPFVWGFLVCMPTVLA
jgi:hypothetical protein